jgi:hypothetical protein
MLAMPLILGLSGCSSPTQTTPPDVYFPPTAVEVVPPVVYAEWWATVVSRAGTDAVLTEFAAIRWFEGPAFGWPVPLLEGIEIGVWIPDNRIVVAQRYALWEPLVSHEMLHAILQGDPEHTHSLWADYIVGSPFVSPGS